MLMLKVRIMVNWFNPNPKILDLHCFQRKGSQNFTKGYVHTAQCSYEGTKNPDALYKLPREEKKCL